MIVMLDITKERTISGIAADAPRSTLSSVTKHYSNASDICKNLPLTDLILQQQQQENKRLVRCGDSFLSAVTLTSGTL
jgi:DNA polymerase III sliding clamp (beta) subunit (PCNA family)